MIWTFLVRKFIEKVGTFCAVFVQNHTLKFILTVWYGDKFKSVQIATNTLIIKIYACKIQQKDK